MIISGWVTVCLPVLLWLFFVYLFFIQGCMYFLSYKYSETCIKRTPTRLATVRLIKGVRLIQVLVNC